MFTSLDEAFLEVLKLQKRINMNNKTLLKFIDY